ncbi:MAG: MFS transporter [Bacteroidota bacterium]
MISDTTSPSTRRERTGWYMYDWANSAFGTTVVAVFLGPYLTSIAKTAADSAGFIYPLGVKVHHGSFFPYIVSLSVFLQVFVLPLAGAIADRTRLKKHFLFTFAYIGSFATMAMFFLKGDNYALGAILFLIANISFGASVVFSNAFLPELAAPEDTDKVSANGWAVGYLGGGLLLAVNLAFFSNAEKLGFTTGEAVRVCFLSAGVWWALFSIIPLFTLKVRGFKSDSPQKENLLKAGFVQLIHTLKDILSKPATRLFLIAYLLYNDGIQTVIALAAQFGSEELHLDVGVLTTAILLVQFVAFFGSLLFKKIAQAISAKKAIILSLVIWIGTLVYAYAFIKTATDFYILSAVIGLVLGGSQALSRSVFSQMVPLGRESEYFSFYEISDKGTSWIGSLLFGLSLQITNSYRMAILSLVILFVAGFLLLLKVNVEKAREESLLKM